MILITGGTGFIGSHLTKQLLTSGKSIRSIKRADSKIPSFLEDHVKIEWVDADLLDYFSLQEAFQGVKEVYHCAAMVSYSPKDHKQIMNVNIQGTINIVNLCLDNNARLLHVSSVAALGDSDDGNAITEKSYWQWNKNKSTYSVSKYEAEREIWRGVAEGLKAVIVNPSIVIGPSKEKSESGKLFELLEKGSIFYPSGSAGFVNVEDVAATMIQLMNKPDMWGKAFILNETNISFKKLFSEYATLTGNPPPRFCANKMLMEIAWRIASVLRALGVKRLALTKEIAKASIKHNRYSNQKIVETLDYTFKPLNKSLEEIHASLTQAAISDQH